MKRFTITHAMAATALISSLSFSALAAQVRVDASLANPILTANAKQTTYLKVGLCGFRMENESARTPVNIALVIDKSGSMQGAKISQAKEAAIAVVDRLNSNDIISIVAYSSGVEVLVPATKLSDKEAIRNRIRKITAGGSTALFAGTSKGAAEIRKFLDRERVNRVILLSDGLANIGPETPSELGALGRSLAKEGITVSTLGLGLGYNEDLMSQLAMQSDGNHAFIEHSHDIAKILKYELGDVLSVVAQEVVINIQCRPGVRPVKVLGREADIDGQSVKIDMRQIYSEQEKYAMLEIEIDGRRAETLMSVATVNVSYANMSTKTTDFLKNSVAVRFSESEREVEDNVEKEVMAEAVLQVATIENRKAVKLRDEGKLEEAQILLGRNVIILKKQAIVLDSEELEDYAAKNGIDADNLDAANWNRQRKSMRDDQFKNSSQRSY